jgi:hypothetical protein
MAQVMRRPVLPMPAGHVGRRSYFISLAIVFMHCFSSRFLFSSYLFYLLKRKATVQGSDTTMIPGIPVVDQKEKLASTQM